MTTSRQLACIMFTDMVGYTALMGHDEAHAFTLLRKNRSLQKPIIEEFNGRFLKEMGDGILASFHAATEAVNAALKIRSSVRREGLYQLRIGIHLGEVVFENDDVFGDGVNIASRIQSAALPDTICISESVAASLSNKPAYETRFIHEAHLKNVKESIRIFEVQNAEENTGSAVAESRLADRLSGEKVNTDGGSGLQYSGISPAQDSIAVLPLLNLSNDPDQDYFCDGVSEEIINALGQVNLLRVISRTSAFSFKGKTVDVREIGKSLNVSMILEGSVRKSGKRLRINTQLIRSEDGFRIWSGQYDRELEDIFAIQEDISRNVATAIRGFLTVEEKEIIRRPGTIVEAYEYYLKGKQAFLRIRLSEAREQFEKAIALDADYALAYAGLSDTFSWLFEWEGGLSDDLMAAEKNSLRALQLAPNLAESHSSRGYVLSLEKKFGEAEKEFNEAIRINSNCFDAFYLYGRLCFGMGNIEKSAELLLKAAEVRREDYQSLLLAGQSVNMLENGTTRAHEIIRQGLARARKQLETNPNDIRALSLGSGSLFEIGEREEAFNWIERALLLDPNDSSTLVNGACLYAKDGQKGKALDMLEGAFSRGTGNKNWIRHDPDYDSLRQEPRFIALIKE